MLKFGWEIIQFLKEFISIAEYYHENLNHEITLGLSFTHKVVKKYHHLILYWCLKQDLVIVDPRCEQDLFTIIY